MKSKLKAFEELSQIMDTLREKCPWDKKQTMKTLRTLTLEEVYELSNAVIKDDMDEVKKELGDLLLHVMFYSKIGEEQGCFDIAEVMHSLCKKLKYRHPHIYTDLIAKSSKEVEQNWEQLKLKEKGGNKSVLAGVPQNMPSLIKAHRIQEKARGVGFDWQKREQVWDKVTEELNELKKELNGTDKDNIEAEFGDLLFSIINAARLYHINPDDALEKTNQKFICRFKYLEEKTLKQGKSLKEMSLDEMDEIWEEAKKIEK